MTALQEFLNMGGYGIYIWPAYFFTFVVLSVNLYLAHRDFQLRLRNARRMQNRHREYEDTDNGEVQRATLKS